MFFKNEARIEALFTLYFLALMVQALIERELRQTRHAESNESNPFAVTHVGAKGEVAYILTHQPKSFDWQERGARPHPWRQLPPAVFEQVCEGLNSIIRTCA